MKSHDLFHILNLLFYFQYANTKTYTIAQTKNCSICPWNKLDDRWNGFRYDCSCCGFKEIPKFSTDAKKIHLTHNDISTIRNTSFLGMTNLREIYFDHNQLTVIEKNSFAHLPNLWMLVLAYNNLTTPSLESLHFLVNLRHLNICHNDYNAYPKSIGNLVNLRTLIIDIFKGFRFDQTFENLTKLTDFQFAPRKYKVQLTLENDTFIGLRNSNISNVSLVFPWQVKGKIGIDVLKPFRYIKRLLIDLSGGYDIKDILRILHGLRHRSLDYMDLSHNRRDIYRHHHLTATDAQHLFTICVKSIDLSSNTIDHFPFLESLNTNFSKCLEKLVYEGNKDFWTPAEVFGITNFPVIKYVDFSIYPWCTTKSMLGKTFTRKSHFYTNVTLNLASIEYLDISSIDFSILLDLLLYDPDQSDFKLFINFQNLRTLKAANTYLDICGRNVYFKRSLVTLDMSGWNCQYLNPTFLWRHKDLVYLNASNANIGSYINDKNFSLFTSLSKLQNVDLSRNNIYRFRTDFFDDQAYSLHHLNLSFNIIKNVPEMLLHLKDLRSVYIQYNEFISFDDMDRYIIDALGNTTFDFKGNIFECTCQYIDSLVWLNRTTNIRNNLICKDGTDVSMVLRNINHFWLECLSKFWLDFSIIALLLVMVTLLVATIGYRNKSFVIYLYIKARRHIRRSEAETRRNDYTYDVFVSYSHLDYDWVTGPLYHYLSNELSLKVCLHQKDFIPGEPIASEILRCIESSRKTVFVITRNFLASKWSMMEMDIARHHVFRYDNDTIIVILKEHIPVHEMSLSLRTIWWRIVCLKYPQNDSQFEHDVFEKQLSEAF